MRWSWIVFLSALIATILFALLAIRADFGGTNKEAWAFFFLSLSVMLHFFPVPDNWRRIP